MPASKKILIIDDSKFVRTQVSRVLSRADLDVIEAGDGLIGLEKLKENPDVAVIVCDINMPRMGGIEFLEALRAQGNSTPVVMLTTELLPELMARGRELGSKAWITKPFKPELFVAAILKLLESP